MQSDEILANLTALAERINSKAILLFSWFLARCEENKNVIVPILEVAFCLLLIRFLFTSFPKYIRKKFSETRTNYPELEKLKKAETRTTLKSSGSLILSLYWIVIIGVFVILLLAVLNEIGAL